jgi:subtilisin family serine protease
MKNSLAFWAGIFLALFALPLCPKAASAVTIPEDLRTRFETLFLSRQASAPAQLSLEPSAPGQALVYFASNISDTKARKTIKDVVSPKAVKARLIPGLYRVEIADQGSTAKAQLISQLSAAPGVLVAMPNHTGAAGYQPNDTLWPQLWHLNQATNYDIDAPQAWDLSRGSSATVIAILDSGIRFDHPELAGRFSLNPGDPINGLDDDGNGLVDDHRGWNFVDPQTNTQPDNDQTGHGTSVALAAAATANNAFGSAGVDHFARVLPLRVLQGVNNSGASDDLVDALIYAALHSEVDVVNLSLVGYQPTALLASAMDFVLARSKLLAVCAGNAGPGTADLNYPAAYGPAVTVGWTGTNSALAPQSSTGLSVDVVAPGELLVISSALPPFSAAANSLWSGCSFATPLVAGSAGLVRAAFPGVTQTQFEEILRLSSQDLGAPGRDIQYGWGSLRLHAALLQAYSTLMVFQDGFNSGNFSAWSAHIP